MAITLGTPTNSGNLTGSTGTTLSHTTAANTKTLAVIITGADSSDTDSNVTGITFNDVALTSARRYRVNPYQVWIWYLEAPYIGTANVVVTMGGSNTDLQVTAVGLISTADRIIYDFYGESLGSSNLDHGLQFYPSKIGSIAIGGIVNVNGSVSNLSVIGGTEIAGSEADMGNQVVSCAYRIATTNNISITWSKNNISGYSYAAGASFYEQSYVTVALNSPANTATNQSLTPALQFTGTDVDSDVIDYQVQVDKLTSFNSLNVIDYLDIGVSSTIWSVFASNFPAVSQSFSVGASSKVIHNAYLRLIKGAGGAGTATVKIYSHSGTYGTSSIPGSLLATSDTFDLATLTTSVEGWVNFVFSGANAITLNSSTNYVFVFENTSALPVQIVVSNASQHSGNAATYYSSTWTTRPNNDFIFVISESVLPLIDKLSSVPDAGFTGTLLNEFTSTGSKFLSTIGLTGIAVAANGDIYMTNSTDIYKCDASTKVITALNATGSSKNWSDITINDSNGDMYATVNPGDVYKYTIASGVWTAQVALGGVANFSGISVNPTNNDVWVCVDSSSIFKQAGGSGSWDNTGAENAAWMGISVSSSTGYVYANRDAGYVYRNTGGGWISLGQAQTTYNLCRIAVCPITNDVYLCAVNGYIYKQAGGTGSFVQESISRSYTGISINHSNGDVVVCTGAYSYNSYIKAKYHIFTSGSQTTYTVQSELIPETTYYWRVRAIDFNGSGTWGTWSETRSFTTQADGISGSIAEALTATESESAIQTSIATKTEAVSALETGSGVKNTADTITEATTATDTQNCGLLATSSQSEPTNATDTTSAIIVVSAATVEPATAIDNESAISNQLAAKTEPLTAIDTPTGTQTAIAARTETNTATDNPSGKALFPVTITETGTAQDLNSGLQTAIAQDSEGASAVDQNSAIALQLASELEATNATDQNTGIQTSVAAIVEGATATEQNQGVLQVQQVTISEAGNAIDTLSAIATLTSAITEAGAGTDSPSAIKTTAASNTEAGTANDNDSSIATFPVVNTEAASATDLRSAIMTGLTSIVEPGNATETSNRVNTQPANQVEAGSALDTHSVVKTTPATINEAGTATDTQTTVKTSPAVITESGSALDIPTAIQTSMAAIAEAGSAQTIQDFTGSTSVSTSESAPALDTETATQTSRATQSETGTVADTVNAIYTTSGTRTEAVNAIDSPDAAIKYPVAISETATAQETSSGELSVGPRVLQADISEVANVTDHLSATAVFRINVVEAGAVLDYPSGLLTTFSETNENCTASDLHDAAIRIVASADIIESINVLDEVSALREVHAATWEDCSVIDVILAEIQYRVYYPGEEIRAKSIITTELRAKSVIFLDSDTIIFRTKSKITISSNQGSKITTNKHLTSKIY